MKKVALILILIGALNWGGVGVFGLDFLGNIFGGTYQVISRIIYFIIGLAGIYAMPILISNDK